jgi:hypothetical protein
MTIATDDLYFRSTVVRPPASPPEELEWASGGCACGAIGFEVLLGTHATICHCDTCRRVSGAAGMPWAKGNRRSLRMEGGPPGIWRSSNHAQRWFCKHCGAQLFCLEDQDPESVEVAVGTLSDPQAISSVTHSYASRRPVWDELSEAATRS